MEVTSPSSLWKDFDVTALPLNISELTEKTENGLQVKELYFDGLSTTDGRVRAYMKILENQDGKGVILYLPDKNGDGDDDTARCFRDLGYTVATLDYLGADDRSPRYTLYPKSLSQCNCRGAVSFTASEEAGNCPWYVWTCIARRAIMLLHRKYRQNIFALGRGLGGCTVYKLGIFDEGLTACATLLNVLPEIHGTNDNMLNYRASMDNTAYAAISTIPMFIAVASNDEDGSLDSMATLAANTASLKTFRIVERAFSGGIKVVYPQIDRFFADGAKKRPTPKVKAVNSENNLYFNISIDEDENSASTFDDIRFFSAFCIEKPEYRNWTNIPLVSLGEKAFLARADVLQSDKRVYGFVNIYDENGDVSSSQLTSIIPKMLGITPHQTIKRRLIYDGSMGCDVWTSPNGGKVDTKTGLYGIEGVYSDTNSLATFKPGDLLYRADDEVLLQIIASGKPQTLNITVSDGSALYYCSVNINNAEDWHKFTLSNTDFKNGNGQLIGWRNVVMMAFDSDSEFLLSSILWV